jgi:hypothetical protein
VHDLPEKEALVIRAILVALTCAAICPRVLAQHTNAMDAPFAFERGTFTLAIYPAFELSGGRDRSNLASATVGVGYYVLENVALNLELSGYHVNQAGPDANAGGLQLLMRHHLWVRERFSLFADVGGGIFRADERVPRGGTHFNFTFRSGVGVTWELAERVHLLSGLRYFHLSNAARRGLSRNPSVNGAEVYVGLLFEL